MRRRGLRLGLVLLALYVVVLAVTVDRRDDHVRPLYDGFAPPTPYRWVDPPSFFAGGNVAPTATTVSIPLGRAGSAAAGVATPDGQFVLNFGRGAIAPRNGAKRVAVKVTPVDPTHLARVPNGLRANGNAYRVELSYRPGGDAVDTLARPGSLVIEIPELGSDLFTSPRGAQWLSVASRTVPPRQLSLAASFTRPGYYVGATALPELVAPTTESSDHAVVIGIVTAAIAALVLVGAFLYARRRRRRAAA